MTRSLAALTALALLVAPAIAQEGVYLELGGGFTSTTDMEGLVGDVGFEAGYALDALIGYRWEDALGALDLGLEAEGIFTRQAFDDQLLGPGSSGADYLSTGAFLFGGSLTWDYSDEIEFYGGGAIGVATSMNLEDKGNAASGFGVADDTATVYQGKAGVRFTLGENLSWYLQYRRMQSEEITIEDNFLDQRFGYEIEQNIVEVGLRYGY